MIFKLQYDDNEYYLVNDMNITIATTDKILLKEDSDMGKLSLKNCQAIENGYDLDELINRAFDNMGYHSTVTPYEEKQFKLGYMVAFREVLEILGDKKFSIDDIQNIIDSNEDSLIYQTVNEDGDISFCLDEDVLIQSLQKTEWDVEIVMDICGDKVYAVPEPVLDENGCLILKRK